MIKAKCITCEKDTNHIVLQEVTNDWETEDKDINGTTTHQIIECQGCNTRSFRIVNHCSEDMNYQTGELEPSIAQYPTSQEREAMHGHHMFPDNLEDVYLETITALNAKLPILATIGLRAMIEVIAINKSIRGRTLQMKINNFVTTGLLTQTSADILHKIRDIGNDAAHKIQPSTVAKLNSGVEVLETLMKMIFILPRSHIAK